MVIILSDKDNFFRRDYFCQAQEFYAGKRKNRSNPFSEKTDFYDV